MADRIFPTTKQDGELASSKEFSGINWDKFASILNDPQVKIADKLPENFENILNADIEDDDSTTEAACKDSAGMTDDGKCKKNTGRFDGTEMPQEKRNLKVHFSSASQISAEAIRKAKEEGNDELVRAQLAARQQRRTIVANRIAEAEKAAANNVKLAQRQEYREALLAQIETEAPEEKKGTTKMASDKSKKINISVTQGFKKVSQMNSAERRAFASAAVSQGFPEEYVTEMLAEKKVEASSDVKQIKQVMASKLPMSTKKAALTGLIKTAELDAANKERLIRYWVDDLKYGDEEWVRNWINKKY